MRAEKSKASLSNRSGIKDNIKVLKLKAAANVNDDLKKFLRARERRKNMVRNTDISDVSGMVKNLNQEIDGIDVKERHNKKVRNADLSDESEKDEKSETENDRTDDEDAIEEKL